MADDSGKHLEVALVAAERVVWEGQAKIVIARTTDGDVGILPGHAPLLGLLQGGTVQVRTVDDEYFVAAAPDGFLSVANDRVSILAENAEMGHDIDLEEARARAGSGRRHRQCRRAGAGPARRGSGPGRRKGVLTRPVIIESRQVSTKLSLQV
jgi:F-type H+-transporting ATPase subunit epsilon